MHLEDKPDEQLIQKCIDIFKAATKWDSEKYGEITRDDITNVDLEERKYSVVSAIINLYITSRMCENMGAQLKSRQVIASIICSSVDLTDAMFSLSEFNKQNKLILC